MKVFISHSSKDALTAKQIAQDLEQLGAATFLDAKDIATGASIDVAIRKNIKDCDHFLILISPAALESDWVLLELGGALTLRKTIIPILLYVGSNDLPQAINLTLARDISEIGKYYAEVRATMAGLSGPRRRRRIAPSTFKKGDVVRVVRDHPKYIVGTEGRDIRWVDDMDKFLRAIAVVRGVDDNGYYALDIDGGRFFWAVDWLVAELRPKTRRRPGSQRANRRP